MKIKQGDGRQCY